MVETDTGDPTVHEYETPTKEVVLDGSLLESLLSGIIVESSLSAEGDPETVEIFGVPSDQKIRVIVRRHRFPKGMVKALSESDDPKDHELARYMTANNARPEWVQE